MTRAMTALVAASGVLVAAAAQGETRQRPLRVGNTNVAFLGAGVLAFEHPNYAARGFPNIGYQRRILRREMRYVPLWVRGSVNFTSEDRKTENAYTVWPSDPGLLPFREATLEESTSDFTVRVEMLGDAVHTANAALYGGAGFALHHIAYNTRGCAPRGALCSSNTYKHSDDVLAPSFVGGVRLFAARRPYTLYGEVRYGRAYGKIDVPAAELPLTDQSFEFTGTNAVSFEAGIGMHW